MQTPHRSNIWTWLAGLGLTLAMVAVVIVMNSQSDPARARLAVYGVVPPFALTNQAGQECTDLDLRGKIWLGNIIFTRCAGPCPKMTRLVAELSQALADLPQVRFVSLTADPSHDTPEVLARYAQGHRTSPDRWWFLTGPKGSINQLAIEGLKLAVVEMAPAERQSPADLFVHSTVLTLVDRRGRLRAFYEGLEPENRPRIVAAIRKLAEERRTVSLSDLPHLNAGLNLLSAVFLVGGFLFIRKGRVSAHRDCMVSALVFSTLFLVSYVVYHFNAGRMVFREPVWFRPCYLALLLSHTVLAMAVVPLVLLVLRHAWHRQFDRHRRLARWTWPLWCYVSVSGVLIYCLLYHIFPQHHRSSASNRPVASDNPKR